MSRYIDADNLKKSVENWLELDRYYHPYSKGVNIPTSEVLDLIETEPTSDVVEVVRCKDCKHLIIANGRDYPHFEGDMYCYPPNMDCNCIDGTDDYWLDVNPDGYCSWGERREDAEIH